MQSHRVSHDTGSQNIAFNHLNYDKVDSNFVCARKRGWQEQRNEYGGNRSQCRPYHWNGFKEESQHTYDECKLVQSQEEATEAGQYADNSSQGQLTANIPAHHAIKRILK